MAITVSGTSIVFNDATTQTTAFTGGGGTVTSVATGNGLSGGTITTTGTLVVACPGFNTVGSYCVVGNTSGSFGSGGNYAAGSGGGQLQSALPGFSSGAYNNNLSGTWKWMAAPNNFGCGPYGVQVIACRVS